MRSTIPIFLFTLLTPPTSSLPLAPLTTNPLTLSALLTIAPTSSTCASAPYPSECRTASQALPHILSSFTRYNITHPSVQAALVSLMAYESADFKYNINHFPAPGVPGKGTRNTQSPRYNVEYAGDLAGDGVMGGSVLEDEASFGSAAWFVVRMCGLGVRETMWGGGRAGWEEYLRGCVGVEVDEGRVEYWERAVGVLGTA